MPATSRSSNSPRDDDLPGPEVVGHLLQKEHAAAQELGLQLPSVLGDVHDDGAPVRGPDHALTLGKPGGLEAIERARRGSTSRCAGHWRSRSCESGRAPPAGSSASIAPRSSPSNSRSWYALMATPRRISRQANTTRSYCAVVGVFFLSIITPVCCRGLAASGGQSGAALLEGSHAGRLAS